MPLQDYMSIVSVDDHLVEHWKVWSDRLPQKYASVGPHVVEEAGVEYWIYEDRRVAALTGMQATVRHERDGSREGYAPGMTQHSSQVAPGCYDPVARLEDMDLDGVEAELCFPTFARFAGTRFLEGRDPDLALLCVQAYNDFVIDEWCQTAPDRYIPMAIVPLWDPQLAAKEVERASAKGARTIGFPENCAPLGLPSLYTDHWDPLFRAAEEAQLPLSIHIGTSGVHPSTSPDADRAAGTALWATHSMATAVDMCFSSVFRKFPRLKVALSEGGIGWIPFLLERMDYTWERQRSWSTVDKNVAPSELFRRHIYGCFIDDEIGVKLRNEIGIENIMLETDYPHSDTTFPHSRKRAAQVLADVSDADAHRIVELNARKLYRFMPKGAEERLAAAAR